MTKIRQLVATGLLLLGVVGALLAVDQGLTACIAGQFSPGC
jgi:preprotein translocase subunit Sss1